MEGQEKLVEGGGRRTKYFAPVLGLSASFLSNPKASLRFQDFQGFRVQCLGLFKVKGLFRVLGVVQRLGGCSGFRVLNILESQESG